MHRQNFLGVGKKILLPQYFLGALPPELTFW